MPINPTIVTLTEQQTVQCNWPEAAGAITWTLNPPGAGTITAGGWYTAPAAIPSPLLVGVTATAGGATETAQMNLVPPEVVLVPGATVVLTGGQAQQFAATVPGDAANGVNWNISPGVGTIDDSGRYVAPNPIARDTDVTVTAMSRVNAHKSATATVRLMAEPPWGGWLAGLFLYLALVFGSVICMAILWPPGEHNNLDSLHTARITAENAQQQSRSDEFKAKAAQGQAEETLQKDPANADLKKKAQDAKAVADKAGATRQTAEAALEAALEREKQEADRVRAAESAPVNTQFGPVSKEVDLMWLVLLAGALGSFVYGAKSFVAFVGNRKIRLSWSAWYLMYPLIGAALALVFSLAVRGGLLMPAGKTSDINIHGLLAISGMVGMFSKQATNKLDELFTILFKTDKDDQRLKGKLNG